MNTQQKRMKPWMKWTLGVMLGLLFVVLAGVGWLYYQVKSISLDDIKERHAAQTPSNETNTEVLKSEEPEVPKALDGAIGTANELATKPIEAQDALDVAAILLNSGLSLKQIYWLQGSASDKLSTEEKQHIRDVLLEKLSKDEIEALRGITTPYGKGLVILDPNYPIEAVGVKDQKERERILSEAMKKQDGYKVTASKDGVTPAKDSSPDSTDGSTAQPTPTPQKLTKEQIAQKQQILTAYQPKVTSLQTRCEGKSNALLAEIVADINNKQAAGEKVTIGSLQKLFLPKIAESEGQCDAEFNEIMAGTQKELKAVGVEAAELSAWQTQYTQAKEQARSKALGKLSASLSK